MTRPFGYIIIFLGGWDHDPRELKDIPEAAAYVRRWAELAGLDAVATAKLVDAGKTPMVTFGLLAGCSCFGPEWQRRVRGTPPGEEE